jgi:hypothetical protein
MHLLRPRAIYSAAAADVSTHQFASYGPQVVPKQLLHLRLVLAHVRPAHTKNSSSITRGHQVSTVEAWQANVRSKGKMANLQLVAVQWSGTVYVCTPRYKVCSAANVASSAAAAAAQLSGSSNHLPCSMSCFLRS